VSKTQIFRKIPPLEARIQPDDTLLCLYGVLSYCLNINSICCM